VLAITTRPVGAGRDSGDDADSRGILRANAVAGRRSVGILKDDRIQPGEKVLTAGASLIFRAGCRLGWWKRLCRTRTATRFVDVIVTPAAHLNRLDEVL